MYLSPEDRAYVGKLKMDLASLTEFERSVRSALDELLVETGPMAKFGGLGVAGADHGTGFNEAYAIGIVTAFAVGDVSDFLRMLHRQMEALALTIKMISDETAETDEERRAQLSKLLYGDKPGREPWNADPAPQGAAVPPAAVPPTNAATPGSVAGTDG
ncbi:hypothetical protein [Streptodolium elevatio]